MNLKRKREEKAEYAPDQLYGIVITGRDWVLLRLEGKGVKVHKNAPMAIRMSALDTDEDKKDLQHDIKKLIEYILKLYHQVREESTGNKRARLEE